MKYCNVYCRLLLLLLCAVLCVTLVYAQDDVSQTIHDYQNSYSFGSNLLNTLLWSCAYLLIYACALVVTLSVLQVFLGFDTGMYLWIVLLWLGGLAANFIGYSLSHNHFLAALLAMPLIFAWSYLLGTRSFTDLSPRHALIVSLVVALLCAPYFGATWQMH